MLDFSETKFNRLRESIESAQLQMDFPRKERLKSIRQFVGSRYQEGGAPKRVPVNMLKLAVDIYVRQLAARAPRVLITTKNSYLKSTAANLELAVNQIPPEIGLTATLRRLVTEALFSIGIVKIGLHTTGKILGHPRGSPFVDIVTLDDFFCDMSAKQWDQIQYCGNDYWLPFEDVKKLGWFDKKDTDDLEPDEYTTEGETGQPRAEEIQNNESVTVYRKRIWLRDVWLSDEQVLLTYAVTSKKLLRVINWKGPKNGPYYFLGFTDVPGNLLPLSPVSVWHDLHELANSLFRKLGKQADSEKSVLGFSGGNEESVKNFKEAEDGDGISYAGSKAERLTAGGVNQTTLAFYLQCRDLYSYFAGNLDTLGGLSPMTETVGQDKLLSEAAGAQMRDMASKTIITVRDIFRALAHYEWRDPASNRTLEKKIPGTDLSIPVKWNNGSRIGNFDSYDLELDVYSLQDDSPGLKLQKLGAVMQSYILPLMPAIQEAGGTLDIQRLLQLVAKYADLEEISEIVTFMDAPMNQGNAGAPPAGPKEESIRRTIPGASDRGKSQVLQNVLLGGKPQDAEMATIGRSTG